MKRALIACFLIACGGETTAPVVGNPVIETPSTPSTPAPSTPSAAPEQVADPPPAESASRITNDIDDPSFAAYCAEKTHVPTRGSIQGDDYFWTDGAIDITGGVSDRSVGIDLRWPSKLEAEPNTGEAMRSDRYSYMTMTYEGELVVGKAINVLFSHGGGGFDCSLHSSQGGDASGALPGDKSTLTLTKKTDTLVEGTLDVPTDEGVHHLAFSAPIVPPAPTTTPFVCCLGE